MRRFGYFLQKFTILTAIFCFCAIAKAKTGDTTHVSSFSNYLWTYYGDQYRTSLFPDTLSNYQKILMRFTLAAPKGQAAGQWDYTMRIWARQHTGVTDSSLHTAPSYTVNGSSPDSIRLSKTQTYTYSWDSTKKKVDTTSTGNPYTILIFGNRKTPFAATDTLKLYKAGYFNHIYGATGQLLDTVFVPGDTELFLSDTSVYIPFEVIHEYEIGRFITPMGSYFTGSWSYTWTMDVTPYAFLFHDAHLGDSVEIHVQFDGYTQGSVMTIGFDCIAGTPPYTAYKIAPLWDGAYGYGNASDPISNHVLPQKIGIDSNADLVFLRIFTTGHGNGTDGAGEFAEFTHQIEVNGTGDTELQQHLWRDDCAQDPLYPQAGTWWYPRGGWCPGDIVYPWVYDVTSKVKRGDSATVSYHFADYTNTSGSGAVNIVSGNVIYAKGPNYNLDVAIDSILEPNNAYIHRRINPVCSNDTEYVILQNFGKTPVTSVTINYGVDDSAAMQYSWKGQLNFMDTTLVALPGIDLGTGTHRFYVHLSSPNGSTDENPYNDTMSVGYTAPISYKTPIKLNLKVEKEDPQYGVTNNIEYDVYDINGNDLYTNTGFNDGQTVLDTFKLAPGCYKFVIYDNSPFMDGLYNPVDPGATPGSFTLKDGGNTTVFTATSSNHLANFGTIDVVPFNIENTGGQGVDAPPIVNPKLSVYPNPSIGTIHVDCSAVPLVGSEYATISVLDILGHQIFERRMQFKDMPVAQIDLGTRASGTYFVRVESAAFRATERFVIGK